MRRKKEEQKNEVEGRSQKTIQHYQHSDEPSLEQSAEKFGVAYSIFQGRLQGGQTWAAGHLKMQVLSEYEEKSIVRWCKRMDKWGHPPVWVWLRVWPR
ncbi:hypothetical protein C7212DRAFT_170672 [Tuber magnatum]|uniref:HTH psq-type domain-containing protein n=1 Tax=Tuber magnatum TaxID=42249 RepID=A0A317SZ51_9PEZI|nr:hypothetical protein C7212DRAFT_170672 [Tuber magnatum]